MIDISKSSAQNYEDVTILYALDYLSKGFYIDVGANSPTKFSVTKLLYDQGWSGIDIEPNPKFRKEYIEQRTRNIFLQMAVMDASGFCPFYCSADNDDMLSSLCKKEGLEKKDYFILTDTLANICSKSIAQQQIIHVLKIDTEGADDKVIYGNDWKRYRPWIIVVESICIKTRVFLIGQDYRYVYCDGLNMFFVSNEHKELFNKFEEEFNFPSQKYSNRSYPLQKRPASFYPWIKLFMACDSLGLKEKI